MYSIQIQARSGFLALSVLLFAGSAQAAVYLSVAPEQPLIEMQGGRQLLNFDIQARNEGTAGVKLAEVVLTVRDASGVVALQRFINQNGVGMQLESNALGVLKAGEATSYFNPFYDFAPDMPLASLEYRFRYTQLDGPEENVTLVVHPQAYKQRARLRLPVEGALLSYDAHDFYSHHRRTDLTSSFLQKVGITRNSQRYSYDLSIVDDDGRMFKGDGKTNSDWYSWDQPVHAPGTGKVVRMANDRPDQDISKPDFAFPGPPYDPTLIFGNYVVIDHGNGEFSLLAHMRQGSVRVKVGDAVTAGDDVGRVGFSGAVITIHTHYQLQNGPDYSSEGLPSTFRDFERIRGKRLIRVRAGSIDTGEIVRSTAH